jgi:peptidoglycan/LPS O-acetylase OafA/YrhL
MLPSLRNPKPLVSTLLALLVVVAQIVPFLSVATLAGPTTPWDVVQAGAIHWGIVGGLALIWFYVQLFWKAPVESTKLGLAASATIFWLALTLFFNFTDPTYGGPVAFFALMGSLGIVLLWTRFIADEISF